MKEGVWKMKFKTIKQSTLPTNEKEEKKEFLLNRKVPQFLYDSSFNYGSIKKVHNIRFDLFNDSKRILEVIVLRYGSFDDFISHAYGKELTFDDIQQKVIKYLKDRKLIDVILISYVKNITCSAKLISLGYDRRLNRPECRKYNLLINIRPDNIFLREYGIECLLDHEIGTHFVRAYNEGFQPWYWGRWRFHLSTVSCYEYKQIEEGLATVNTALAANDKYLGTSALLYYATCMSHYLSFGQLFDHLNKYIHNKDYRWKHCVRIKKSLNNVNDIGGYAKDQCYFEGAYYLLANLKNIDFDLLCRGKLTVNDLSRVRRIVRNNIGQIPIFMRSIEKYKKQLMTIANINGIRILPCNTQALKKFTSDLIVQKPNHQDQCMEIDQYLKTMVHSVDSKSDEKKTKSVLPKILKNSKYSKNLKI